MQVSPEKSVKNMTGNYLLSCSVALYGSLNTMCVAACTRHINDPLLIVFMAIQLLQDFVSIIHSRMHQNHITSKQLHVHVIATTGNNYSKPISQSLIL